MLDAAKRLLGNVNLYMLLQRGVGADRLRYKCLEYLELKPDEVVLDIGCGPAYYFERIGDARYFGFDTDQRYIDHAKSRWGDRGEFRCEIFTEAHAAQLPPVNKVLLFGLLHHLSDEQSLELLHLAAQTLAPGGVVISVDPCFEPSQGRISHWMSANDRGEFVRTPEQFTALANRSFGQIDGEIWNQVTRIPSSHWMMRMSVPV